MQVVIIGAGPCGLTAAWELAQAGFGVTLIERDSAVGGLCKTVRRNGYQFDMGGHRFISRNQELVDNVKRLMGERLMARQRRSAILFPGRRFKYPLDMGDILRNGSLMENAGFALGYLAAAMGISRSSAPQGSFQRWAETQFGKPLYKVFFGPYTAKLWGVDPGTLSGQWAPGRISLLSALDAVMKAAGLGGQTPRTYARTYLYPMGGIGEIFETMAARVTSLGGRLLLGHEVESMVVQHGRVEAVAAKGPDGGHIEVEGDLFLSTAPLGALTRMIDPKLDLPLPSRGLRFLNMILDDEENLSEYTWQYTPSADVVMTRIQEPKRRSPWSAPEGKTSVMLEIPCDPGGSLWRMEDTPLMELALEGMKKLGYRLEGKVAEVFSTREPEAYPLMTLGCEQVRDAALGAAGALENLATEGRQGRFGYIFMDQAMLAGRRWARRIINGDTGAPPPEDQPGVVHEAGSLAE